MYFLPPEAKPNEWSPTARRKKPRRKRGGELRSLTQTAAMKMASFSGSHIEYVSEKSTNGGKKQLFIHVFSHSGFSTEDGNETTVAQSREGSSACSAFTGWCFGSSPPFSLKRVKHVFFLLQCGNSEGKVRKRRRVLKTYTTIDEDGCMGTEAGRMLSTLQLQKSQISLCPVQQ